MSEALTDIQGSELEDFLIQLGIKYTPNVKLASFTKMNIGGQCPYLIEPENIEQLTILVKELVNRDLAYRILGAGSNLVIDEKGIKELVIKLGRGFRSETVLSETEIEVSASMPLMAFSRKVSERGLSGLEFAGGIPASIGGAVRMNAGAHGGQMSDVIKNVTFIDPQKGIVTLSADEIKFEYRKTSIPKDAVIVKTCLSFIKSNPEKTFELMKKNLDARKAAQPLTLPSSGSVFKNPSQENTAGKILERCGVKGRVCGGASVSTMHANWIINEKKTATAGDVIQLIKDCQKIALEKEGVALVPELIIWLSN